MDMPVLKTLLAAQDKAFRSALGVFTKQVNEKIQALQSSVSEVTRSLEFTQREVDDLNREVKQHETEDIQNKEVIKKLNEDLKTSGQIIQDLEDRCNYQEDYNRRNNLQIIGLEERPDGETWEQTAVRVSKLLRGQT